MHSEGRESRGQDSWPVADLRPSIPATETPDISVLRGQAPVWPILPTSWSRCSWPPRATPLLSGGFRKKSGQQRAHSSGIHAGTANCTPSRGHVETWQPCPLSGEQPALRALGIIGARTSAPQAATDAICRESLVSSTAPASACSHRWDEISDQPGRCLCVAMACPHPTPQNNASHCQSPILFSLLSFPPRLQETS